MAESSFPEFITTRRRELDLTLGDVANSMGVSPITVSNWSSGDSTPTAEQVAALADLLEVAPDRLANMAGVTLGPAEEVAVNLMPDAAIAADQSDPAGAGAAPGPPTAPLATGLESGTRDVVAAPADDELPVPGSMDSELVELIEESEPEAVDSPDSVPAFVAPSAPAPAPEPAVSKPAPARRPPRPAASAPEREVTTLPLTYIEDPRQLMRYRIRWVLTVVVLLVMFIILLWASGELISALAEVKQSVTPGGLDGG